MYHILEINKQNQVILKYSQITNIQIFVLDKLYFWTIKDFDKIRDLGWKGLF